MFNKEELGKAPKNEVTNNTSLRHDLTDCYNQLRRGEMGLRTAQATASMARAIVASATSQKEYNIVTGKPEKKIDFFED